MNVEFEGFYKAYPFIKRAIQNDAILKNKNIKFTLINDTGRKKCCCTLIGHEYKIKITKPFIDVFFNYLVFAICHELAHIKLGHFEKRDNFCFLVENNRDSLYYSYSAFRRHLERAADLEGQRLLYEVGLDPLIAVFFLNASYIHGSMGIEKHPKTLERISYIGYQAELLNELAIKKGGLG